MWPGVRGFISCSYTVSHGITPGIAALTIPEQDVSQIAAYGTLVITDGIGTIPLPRCKVVDVKFSGGGGSPRTITLLIADRRWMWKFGGVSGNWNQIDPYPDPDSFPPDEFVASGGPYMPGTYRTAEKLLVDCLVKLNEPNPFIFSPPIIPVAMSWDNEPPAAAMQSVCDAVKYRIAYQPVADRVAIFPDGVGDALPILPSIISSIGGIDPPERPNAFQLVGGDTIWNDYLELEPVTLEQNGEIVAIDDASYKPAAGWGRVVPPNFGQVFTEFGPEKCELAKRHIWRTFRVKIRDTATGDQKFIEIPKYGKVTDRKQIVLGSQLFGTSKDERGQQRTESAYCVGSVYYPRAFDRPVNANITLGAFGNTITGNERLPVRPQIDPGRGLVSFDRHLFRNLAVGTAAPTTGGIGEPELYLRTSFRIRSLVGMVFDQFRAAGVSPVAADPLCPPEFVRHPELVAVINVVRNASKGFRVDDVSDNLEDLKAAADYYLNAADRQYQTTITNEITYGGIVPISPDGAIQQVTWSVGNGPATTQASRNSEHALYVPPFAERRSRERVNVFWGRAAAADQKAAGNGSNVSPGGGSGAGGGGGGGGGGPLVDRPGGWAL